MPLQTEACLKKQTLTGQCLIFSTLKLMKSGYSSAFEVKSSYFRGFEVGMIVARQAIVTSWATSGDAEKLHQPGGTLVGYRYRRAPDPAGRPAFGPAKRQKDRLACCDAAHGVGRKGRHANPG